MPNRSNSISASESDAGLFPTGVLNISCIKVMYHTRAVIGRRMNHTHVWRNCWSSWNVMVLSFMMRPVLVLFNFYILALLYLFVLMLICGVVMDG